MMNDIFRNLIVEEIIVVYLDNIFIFIQTLENHYKTMFRVLEILVEHKLYPLLELKTTYLVVISEPWVHSQKFRNDSEVQ